jgi:hypothetical protein
MKIDETHRDLKHLLGLTKLMNQQQPIMKKMLALLLLVYAIGLLIGEGLRDHLYGEPIQEQEDTPAGERIPGSAHRKPGKKWKGYSGLFVLLKQKWTVSSQEWRAISETALATFLAMVSHPVPTHV